MPTKIADVTVGADGTWSSGPHTLASGARSVTLRRKSDGAVLATRSFTVGSSAVAVSDNFNRANENPLAGNWVALGAKEQLKVINNHAEAAAGGLGVMRRSEAVAADQYAEARLLLSQDAAYATSPMVRVNNAGDTYYVVMGYDWSEDNQKYYTLQKYVGGTQVVLSGEVVFADPVVRLEVSGATVTVKSAASHGGPYTTQISYTDPSPIAGGSVGLCVYGGQADDFYGGDL